MKATGVGACQNRRSAFQARPQRARGLAPEREALTVERFKWRVRVRRAYRRGETMSKKWMGLCSMAVVFMLIAGAGCSKKEEAAQTEQVEEVDTNPAETATAPSAAGTYT